MTDNQELDACDVSFNIPKVNTSDENVDALELFADIDFTNLSEVSKRRKEWEELFK